MFGLIISLLVGKTIEASTFMPVQGSQVAAQVDSLYMFLLVTSAIFCVLVIGGLIYFVLKYRRKSDDDKTAYISHNNFLEFLWSFIPFVLFMIMFGWGWHVFHQMRDFSKDSLEVHAVGQKWFWDFKYKSGKSSTGEFYVPVNTPIKLIMTSKDVLHSFFLPGMRIKQDVIPGRYTALAFTPNKEGTYQVFCTEYCGDQHSSMLAKMKVVSQEEYEQWLQEDATAGLSLVEVGQKVYEQKCAVCHNTDAQRKVGPGFAGLYNSERQFTDGSSLVADENYLRESILVPNAKVVNGYPAAMPSFQGQLSEDELSGLIEFIKSLK